MTVCAAGSWVCVSSQALARRFQVATGTAAECLICHGARLATPPVECPVCNGATDLVYGCSGSLGDSHAVELTVVKPTSKLSGQLLSRHDRT
jgi:hypothetical protein